MPDSKGRITCLYIVAALGFGASIHAFVTEGLAVSSAVALLLAIVLSWDATRQLRANAKKSGNENS